MYDRSYWKDHVTDQQGQIIQQGTLLDQAHFNNLEIGASDNSLALQIMAFKNRQEEYPLNGKGWKRQNTESCYRHWPCNMVT